MRIGRPQSKWLVSFFVTLISIASPAAAQFPESRMYRTEKVGEGIYAFISPEINSPIVSSNCVAVIGDDGVLVVDAGRFTTLTRRMIADIRKLTDKPIRYVVNTHWHMDHVMGNGAIQEAFPDVVILSTAFTRSGIQETAAANIQGMLQKGPGIVKDMDGLVRAGKRADGTALSEQDRKFLSAEKHDLELELSELKLVRSVAPSVTFDQGLTVHLGKREVGLMFLGRGNTAGDTVVYVPDSKVVMTGDLVVNPVPYSFGAYPGEWIETLKKLMAIDATSIIPGHGPVMHDWEYAKLVASLIEAVRTQVQAAVQQGLSLDDTRKRINLDSFQKRFVGDNPDRALAFKYFFVSTAIERAYQEAKGAYYLEWQALK